MMLKKTWMLLLIIILGLAGCSNDAEMQDDKPKKFSKAEEKNKIVAKVELPANQQISANENAEKNKQEKIETKTGPGDGTEESQSKENDVESKEKTTKE